MTENGKTWRRAGALVAVASAGALGVGLFAAPVFAHTPVWSVTCDQVSVDLTAYSPIAHNTVTITVDGEDLLPVTTFKKEFHDKLELPAHDKEVTVRLIVKAGDGDRFSRDETKTAPVCEDDTPSPSPSTTPPSTPPAPTPSVSSDAPGGTPSTTAPATPSAEPSTTAPGGGLAETGGSSTTPLIAGAAAAVILAGGGIMWAARCRRGAQH
ncbi:LAETG motif-containing sortase-dependent surface protein [Streptomyces sp. NPDC048389]|uniref:LAETG motif-containing sortase-dependent surface protein n=1 Tax=Streptomyces sp. NPDC048389 TaxID=3154622 RepID=UPI003453AC07